VKYLLDTHAVLWVTQIHPRLSPRVKTLTGTHGAEDFRIAAITLLEISRLARRGEIIFTRDPRDWLEDIARRFEVLPLTPAIAWRSASLDWTHKDPADRLICATALEHRLTLVTHDKEITRWGGVPVLW
jgi:PIN domain nuclease of toxin-antitoxin system